MNLNRIAVALLTILTAVALAAPDRCAASPDPSEETGGSPRRNPPAPKPTLANVPYGPHERHVLDFWKAESDRPTPLVHDDLADPKSSDPVARESTRLLCAAVIGAQTTLDPQQMQEWTPNSKYGGHAFGLVGFAQFLAGREKILPWIAEYSPYALVTADDPPVYLFYNAPPALGQPQKDPTHTANFGVKLQEKCKAKGVACELAYPGMPGVKHATAQACLIATLKANGK